MAGRNFAEAKTVPKGTTRFPGSPHRSPPPHPGAKRTGNVGSLSPGSTGAGHTDLSATGRAPHSASQINPFDDPIEKEANGFASGLLMPKRLITDLTDGDVNWANIARISEICDSSLEATFRRISYLDKSPSTLIIHQNSTFRRFVPTSNFDFYINRSPLSLEQQEFAVNVKEEAYPSDFETVDSSDWVDPKSKTSRLESIYSSTILLNDGFTYTILTYDDDCFVDGDKDY